MTGNLSIVKNEISDLDCYLSPKSKSGEGYRDFGTQKGLQKKYFSNPGKYQKMQAAFFKALSEGNYNTTMVKTSLGSTGLTFSCSFPSTCINGEKEVQPIGLIYKWQQKEYCEVEKLGSQIFQILGFSSPSILILFPENAQKIKKLVNKSIPILSSFIDTTPYLAMPRLQATNLDEAIKNGSLLKLSPNSLYHLFFQFGKVATSDFLIGNNDRFFRFDSDKNSIYSGIHMNTGNIMFELHQLPNRALFFVECYPIDNCTSTALIPREKKEKLEQITISLFGENSASTSTSSSEESEESSLNYETVVNGYHEVFKCFINNIDDAASHFIKNLCQVIKENNQDIKKYGQIILMAFKSFSMGMKTQLRRIQIHSVAIKKAIENCDSGSSTAWMKKLIEKNLLELEDMAQKKRRALRMSKPVHHPVIAPKNAIGFFSSLDQNKKTEVEIFLKTVQRSVLIGGSDEKKSLEILKKQWVESLNMEQNDGWKPLIEVINTFLKTGKNTQKVINLSGEILQSIRSHK